MPVPPGARRALLCCPLPRLRPMLTLLQRCRWWPGLGTRAGIDAARGGWPPSSRLRFAAGKAPGPAATGEAVSSTAPAPGAAASAPAPCGAGGLVRGSMAPSCTQTARVPTATCVLGALLPVLRGAVATAAGVGACAVAVVLADNGCGGFWAAHGVGSSPCPAGVPTSPRSEHGRAGPVLRPCPEARCPPACPTATHPALQGLPAPFPLTPTLAVPVC